MLFDLQRHLRRMTRESRRRQVRPVTERGLFNRLIDLPAQNTHHDVPDRPRSDDHRERDPHFCIVDVRYDTWHRSKEAAISKTIDENEYNEQGERVGLWPNYEHADSTQNDGNRQAAQRPDDITKVTQSNTADSGSNVEQGKKH